MGLVVEIADGVDLVAEEFDADGAGGAGGPAIEDAAAQGRLALGIDLHAEFIARFRHPFGQFFKRVLFAQAQGADRLLRFSGNWNFLLHGLRAGDNDKSSVTERCTIAQRSVT